MFRKLILFSLLIFISPLYSQEVKKVFPADYTGIYKGELTYETPKGPAKIPMEFQFRKTDSIHKYDYWLVYNNQPRKYSLIVKDSTRGLYEIDENNGIILPARFYEGTLYSWFEVQNNKVSSRLEFQDNKLFFEILFSNTKSKTTTGGVSEQIPQVYGYPISAIQKAVLIKQD